MENEIVINELKKRVLELYPDLIGIYFYGSRIKGNYSEDSDYDLLLLFPNVSPEKKFEIYGIIGFLEYKLNIFIDIKILTLAEFKKNPFYYEQVTNSGIYFGK